MPLVFDDRQLLAPGIQDATLEEIDRHFARFQKTDKRIKLFDSLRAFLGEVARAFIGCQVIIDGSFVMPCVDEPGDIDLILVLPADIDLSGDFKPHQYNLVSARRVKTEFKFDCRTVNAGSAAEQEWIEFFSQVDVKWCRQFGLPADSKKGLVRVLP